MGREIRTLRRSGQGLLPLLSVYARIDSLLAPPAACVRRRTYDRGRRSVRFVTHGIDFSAVDAGTNKQIRL